MPGRPLLTDAQPNFLGGLNVSSDISALAENELWRADNARYIEQGAVTKRLGTQRVSTNPIAAGHPVSAGFEWRRPAGNLQLAICNGNLYKGVYGLPVAWTLVAGAAFALDAQVSFAEFVDATFTDVVYMADGGKLIVYDGTTLSRMATGPDVAELLVYNRRLLGALNAASRYTTYWSALDNGSTLGDPANGGGSAVVLSSAAGQITALGLVGDGVALLQRNGTARFSGLTVDDIGIDSGTRGFSPDTGTLSARTLINYGNESEPALVFLSDNGVYEISSSGNIRTLSRNIDPVISGLDQTTVARAVAVNNRSARELWFYLPDIGIYVYNYRLLGQGGFGTMGSTFGGVAGVGGWSGPFNGIYTQQRVWSMWEATDTLGKRMVLGGFGDGHVRRLDAPGIYKDDVAADGSGGFKFSLVAQLHRMFFGSPTNEKSLWRIWASANLRGSLTATMSWTTSTGGGQGTFPATAGGIWGVGKWGTGKWGASGALARRVDAKGRGPFVDITISDDGLSASAYSRVECQAFDMGQR
jgi:hypothetical protein